VPVPRSTAMASLCVEGRAGEYTGVWGGLKLYVGKSNKTLIRRHREDDPVPWGAGVGREHAKSDQADFSAFAVTTTTAAA